MIAVNTPSAKAEGFSRLRGLPPIATPNVWRGLLGIGYPGYLFREPKFLRFLGELVPDCLTVRIV
jgi:hypothetical protein